MVNFILRAIVGFLGGICSCLGIGSGTVLILYLTMVEGLEQNLVAGINLVFSIPIFIFSIYFNNKNGLICNKDICLKIALYGLVGALLGCYISFNIDPLYLRKIFGAFLVCIAVKGLLTKKKPQ